MIARYPTTPSSRTTNARRPQARSQRRRQLRRAAHKAAPQVLARGSCSKRTPPSSFALSNESSHEIIMRVGALTPTFTSTPADALVSQPLRLARALFLTTKKLAASRRRLSSLSSASTMFFSALSIRASTTSNAASCSCGLAQSSRRKSDAGTRNPPPHRSHCKRAAQGSQPLARDRDGATVAGTLLTLICLPTIWPTSYRARRVHVAALQSDCAVASPRGGKPTVKHPPGPRMKTSRRGAIRAARNPRREVGRAVRRHNKLHTRTKAAGAQTPPTRQRALI